MEGKIALSKTHLVLGLACLLIYQSIELYRKSAMLSALYPVLNPQDIHYSYVDADHPSTLPIHVSHASMTAEWLDDALYGLYADDDWDTLFPAGNGWVTLGPDDDTPPEEESFFVLSMYHQLHCLDTMRYAFVAAASASGMRDTTHSHAGPKTGSKSKSTAAYANADAEPLTDPHAAAADGTRSPDLRPRSSPPPTLDFSASGNGTGIAHHMNHCLQYLREAILCAADTTLEESVPVTNKYGLPDHGATGMGMLHQCRDWEQVRAEVDGRWRRGGREVPVSVPGRL